MRTEVIALMFLLLVGCAPQIKILQKTVPVHPELTYTASHIGDGRPIHLTVSDRRPRPEILGYGGGFPIAQIYATDQDLAGVIKNALQDGLSQLGFRVLRESGPGITNLVVELTHMEFKNILIKRGSCLAGACVGQDLSWGGVTAIAYRNGGPIYKNSYETAVEERNRGFTSTDTVELINSAVGDLIQRVLGDRKLLAALKSTERAISHEAGLPRAAVIGQNALEIPESEQGFYEGKEIHFVVDIPLDRVIFRVDVPRPYLRLVRYTALIARHVHKYLPGSHPYVLRDGGPRIFATDLVEGNAIGRRGVHVYLRGSVPYVHKGENSEELTVGVWAGDRTYLQQAAARDGVPVDWTTFEWIGGLRDEISKKRLFFALPPGTSQTRMDTVRAALEKTLFNPGLLAEARLLRIDDVDHMTLLSAREVEEAL